LFLLIENLRRTRNWTVIRLLAASVCWWILAITCWINDKFFCLIWKSITSIPYPQFHSWWHVFIVLASYTAIVVVAYFRALEECAERRPRIRYWPDTRWAWELGVPYVRIDDHVNAKAE
jgi:alkaline ceramidase